VNIRIPFVNQVVSGCTEMITGKQE